LTREHGSQVFKCRQPGRLGGLHRYQADSFATVSKLEELFRHVVSFEAHKNSSHCNQQSCHSLRLTSYASPGNPGSPSVVLRRLYRIRLDTSPYFYRMIGCQFGILEALLNGLPLTDIQVGEQKVTTASREHRFQSLLGWSLT